MTELTITVIGTIASIIGAIIAIWQAKKAKNDADFVRDIKDKLIDQRTTKELSLIQVYLQRVQKTIQKYGPTSTPKMIKGVNKHEDAQEVHELVLLIKEHRELFGSKKPNEADDLCDQLNALIEGFVSTEEFSVIHNAGNQILSLLSNFIPKIKKMIDKRDVERIV